MTSFYKYIIVSTCGDDDQTPANNIRLHQYDNNHYYGFGANTDIIAASAEAFIDAINKFPN